MINQPRRGCGKRLLTFNRASLQNPAATSLRLGNRTRSYLPKVARRRATLGFVPQPLRGCKVIMPRRIGRGMYGNGILDSFRFYSSANHSPLPASWPRCSIPFQSSPLPSKGRTGQFPVPVPLSGSVKQGALSGAAGARHFRQVLLPEPTPRIKACFSAGLLGNELCRQNRSKTRINSLRFACARINPAAAKLFFCRNGGKAPNILQITVALGENLF